MRILIQSMLAGSLSAVLWVIPASAETPLADNSVMPNSSAAPNNSAAPTDSAVPHNSAAPTDSAVPNNSAAPSDSAVPNNSAAPTDSAVPNNSSVPNNSVAPNNSAAPGSDPALSSQITPADSSAADNRSASSVATGAPENSTVSASPTAPVKGAAVADSATQIGEKVPATSDAQPAGSASPVTQDSSALSSVPPPAGLGNAETGLEAAAGETPYRPGQAASSVDTTSMVSSMLNQPVSSTLNVAQMGQRQGITLTGGQLQSGIIFTLPGDEVVTNARLNLSLRVSQALAARNTSLQLMLNGQPLGTLPLGSGDSDESDYQLDIPAAMIVSSNNLSFKINDADKLLCEKDSAEQYQVTILPKTMLSLEGQQLNIGTSLRNFPRPFIDPQRMTAADVTFSFADNVTPDTVTAAVLVASWLGIQSDYRGIHFPVVRGNLPEKKRHPVWSSW